MPICPKCRGKNPELGAKCPRDEFYYIHDDALRDAERDPWLGRLAADKYVIVGLISEGGMGAVYRAIQLPVQREVAFKVLLADLEDSTQGRDRFAREARAISRLSHPNIITMHDFGLDSEGHPFMAMEYAPGQSLADWMMLPGLTYGRIMHVFRQILSALVEAHDQGVVHRDLKPENLIVTRKGNDRDFIKLLDFGIARMIQDSATRGLTRDGEVFGTPHYMAPEQARGQKDVGPAADVYALGIMLFELLTGECPFDAPTPLSILYMHINDELPPLNPRMGFMVPTAVREMITRATAKDPAERYIDARAMLTALDIAVGSSSDRPQVFHAIPVAAPDGVLPQNVRALAPQRRELATANTLELESGQDAPLADDLEAPQDSGASGAGEANVDTIRDLGSRDRQRPTMLLAILSLMVLLIGAGIWLVVLNLKTRDLTQAAPAAQENASQLAVGVEDKAEPTFLPPAPSPVERPVPDAPAQDDAPQDDAPQDDAPQELAAGGAAADEEAHAPGEGAGASSAPTDDDLTGARRASDAARPAHVTRRAAKASPETDAPAAARKPAKNQSEKSSENREARRDAPAKFEPVKFAPPTSPTDAPNKHQPTKWK